MTIKKPSWEPSAVPTSLGWAHPITGEQLTSTNDIPNPVAYYHPNRGGKSFIDPSDENFTANVIHQMIGLRNVQFAIHSVKRVVSVEWNFDDGNTETSTGLVVHTYPLENAEYTVTANITFGDNTTLELTEEVSVIITVEEVGSGPVEDYPPQFYSSQYNTPQFRIFENLTFDSGGWIGEEPFTYSFVLTLDDIELETEGYIDGAYAGWIFDIPADAIGKQVAWEMIVTDANENSTVVSSETPNIVVQENTIPHLVTPPTISGTPSVGQTISTTLDGLGLTGEEIDEIVIQWNVDGDALADVVYGPTVIGQTYDLEIIEGMSGDVFALIYINTINNLSLQVYTDTVTIM